MEIGDALQSVKQTKWRNKTIRLTIKGKDALQPICFTIYFMFRCFQSRRLFGMIGVGGTRVN